MSFIHVLAMPQDRRTLFFRRVLSVVFFLGSFSCTSVLLLAQHTSVPPAVALRAKDFIPENDLSFPQIRQQWMPDHPVAPYTAAEWYHGLSIYGQQVAADQSPDASAYPKDSILAATRARVRVWLQTLKQDEVRGLQLDPYGTLHVAAGEDDQARRIFARRLATPGMTLSDSAFTLSAAVQAFADPNEPTRIAVAEEYMKRLDVLPKGPAVAGASVWQFMAHQRLAYAYSLIGNTSATIYHAKQAIFLIPTMFFLSREFFYTAKDALDMYGTLADLLFSMHDTTTLRGITQQVLAWARPPDSLVAENPSIVFLGRTYTGYLRRRLNLIALLGESAPPVSGTSWLNVADTGSHAMRLDDGAVHIVGVGYREHGLTMLPMLTRIAAQLQTGTHSRLQPVFLLLTHGAWGTRFVTPSEESAKLRHYFTEVRPASIPVAIWAGEKTRTRDGGFLPAPSPTMQAFKASAVPLIAIVDQHGKVRHFFTDFGHEQEAQIIVTVRLLLEEKNSSGGRS